MTTTEPDQAPVTREELDELVGVIDTLTEIAAAQHETLANCLESLKRLITVMKIRTPA